MDPSSSSQGPQRRLLPSRSRRGGPGAGVGNCEADQMILEINRRKPENEPLIPENTRFFLTTSPALAPPECPIPPILNERANERYFERPELLKACREQGLIETPDFETINDADTVGGRFRPRGSEEGIADTSDAVYERRHKKFEAFEKRGRLREKEKLQHEQYKLRERVEQLRVMEYSAFLALPASAFSPAPGRIAEDGDESINGHPGTQLNGVAAMHEAERRRQEMLDVAQTLEERYKLLLPPTQKIRKTNGSAVSTPTPSIIPPSSSPTAAAAAEQVDTIHVRKPIPTKATKKRIIDIDEGETEVDEDEILTSPTPSPTPSPPPPSLPQREKLIIKLKKSTSNPPASTPVSAPISAPESAVRVIRRPAKKRKTEATQTPPPLPAEQPIIVPDTPISNPDIAVLEQPKEQDKPTKRRGRPPQNPDGTVRRVGSISVAPKAAKTAQVLKDTPEPAADVPVKQAKKRLRKTAPPTDEPAPNRQASMPPIAVIDESVSAPAPRRSKSRIPAEPAAQVAPVAQTAAPTIASSRPYKPGVLALYAQRQAELGRARNTTRHLQAFGVKVPDEVMHELEYELPLHILNHEVFQERYAKYYDPKDTFNPMMVLIPKFFPHLQKEAFEEELVEAWQAANDRAASVGSDEEEGEGEGEGAEGGDEGEDEVEEEEAEDDR
ncbi:hypothetical protein Moror_16447 [Moniliophthora roreri MCA 2997]|uniref:PEHE domain-containing protein n=1 Tax=Moniliophthora roreri (strain MCA 2997) TaxID=1381753 RepID=V2XDM5_MONRO|nr:hypothetical protein Moror_16447 [Moniliophthora roreri MCA 2997]